MSLRRFQKEYAMIMHSVNEYSSAKKFIKEWEKEVYNFQLYFCVAQCLGAFYEFIKDRDTSILRPFYLHAEVIFGALTFTSKSYLIEYIGEKEGVEAFRNALRFEV